MADINNYINAGTYEDLCDYAIILAENKIVTNDLLNKDCIVFCKTDHIDYLFSYIRNTKHSYIIITHHSDYPIDEYRFSLKPTNVKKWFAINSTINDNSIVSIPLGIKTHKGIFLEEKYKTKWFINNLDEIKNNEKENIIYCNWNNTNNYRNLIIEKLNKNNINYKLENNIPFDIYIQNMSKCKYVISPPGNGIDCHRTWEALYVGCIPIVIKNKIYEEWNELPILQVNDYEDLTNELLEEFSKKTFNYEKLYMSYWRNKIKNSL